MIFDCCTYMNERELIAARVRLLKDVVDYFVIVEAKHTFQGEARELDFPIIKNSLDIAPEQIRYIVVSDSPVTATAWEREFHVRNAILRGLEDADANDLVIVSDADEIIRPEVVQELDRTLAGPVALQVRYFTFRVNWEWMNVRSDPRIARFRDLGSPQELRRRRGLPVVPDAGWHVSWLGDAAAARQKLESFSHTEMKDLLTSPRHLETCVRLGVDLLGRGVLRRVGDADAIPSLSRDQFPEYWADSRTPVESVKAVLYNFAVPGLRHYSFRAGSVGWAMGTLRAVAIRGGRILQRIRRRAKKTFYRVLRRNSSAVRR